MFLFYLSSGLFLGWVSGANYMGNVFGTALGTRMLSFTSAAIICAVFIVLGAVYSGGGTAATIAGLGSVATMSGAFVVALAAALAIFVMVKLGLPVSSTQAVLGGIIGWALFVGSEVDFSILLQILASWVASPFLAALFAIILMLLVKTYLKYFPIPLLYQDLYIRIALVLTGAFGAYTLGANNIGNIVGVFLTSSPFKDVTLFKDVVFSAERQLFLIGGLAIALGVFTYSKRLINMIGKKVFLLTPMAAWVVVMSHSLVMLLFASQSLHEFLSEHDLPTIPLVPISSSEAVIGAVVGIAILKKGRGLRPKYLGRIAMGWVICPALALVFAFVLMLLKAFLPPL